MRKTWVDSWRGILIFQIVIFHVLGVAIHNATESAMPLLVRAYAEIASYHVMAFFAITGVVWVSKDVESVVEYARKKAYRLLLPYLVWGLLWAVMFCLLLTLKGGDINTLAANGASIAWWQPFASIILGNGYPNGVGWRVINALWFLPHMFVVLLAYFTIDKFVRGGGGQIFLVLPLFALSKWFTSFGVVWPFRFEWIPSSLIFLILVRHAMLCFSTERKVIAFALAMVFYALFCCPAFVNYISDMVGLESWRLIIRSFLAIMGSAMLAKAVDNKCLETVGKASLGILVTHKFFILAFQTSHGLMKALFAHDSYVAVLLSVCVIAVVVTALAVFATLLIRDHHLAIMFGEGCTKGKTA